MRKSRVTETQIVKILKEVEGGRQVKEVCREYGVSDATYYNWKSKYGGMEASDIRRLKEMEDIALGFKGVDKAYAIQAGRELRVIVSSEKVSDDKANQISFEISQKIQTDMTYPGQVKVTVIRETRSVNIAK